MYDGIVCPIAGWVAYQTIGKILQSKSQDKFSVYKLINLLFIPFLEDLISDLE